MNCEQIKKLLYFYIYDELNNPELDEYISLHLEECDECYEFYEDLIDEIQENKNIESISAYIDNELSSKDSIQVKKNIISNKNFREEFEKLSEVSSLIKNFFSKQEYNVKNDYSKLIFRKLDLAEKVYGKSLFPEIVAIFVVIFIGLFIATVAIFGI
ncbi:hypothetical protein IJ732_07725 [bacterium]|nr:hypothetical protein [bacterium]